MVDQDLFICPRCGSPVRPEDGGWHCAGASCRYADEPFPVVAGVPALVDFERQRARRRPAAGGRGRVGGGAVAVRRAAAPAAAPGQHHRAGQRRPDGRPAARRCRDGRPPAADPGRRRRHGRRRPRGPVRRPVDRPDLLRRLRQPGDLQFVGDGHADPAGRRQPRRRDRPGGARARAGADRRRAGDPPRAARRRHRLRGHAVPPAGARGRLRLHPVHRQRAPVPVPQLRADRLRLGGRRRYGAALVGRLLRPRADPVGRRSAGSSRSASSGSATSTASSTRSTRWTPPAASSSSAARPTAPCRGPTSSTTTRAACSRRCEIVVLTGAGISAESGVPTFRDADGLWEGHRVEDVATPEAYERAALGRAPVLRRPPGRARRRRAQPRPPRAGPARGRGRATTCSSSPRTSTTCTSAPAPPGCCTCTAQLRSALCAACGSRVEWEGDLGDFPPCPACHETALRPDVVWFGEIPYELDRIFTALEECRAVRLDRYVGRRLPRGRLRPGGRGVRRAHARAQPGPERGQPLLRRGPARAGRSAGAGVGGPSCSADAGYRDGMTRLLGLLAASGRARARAQRRGCGGVRRRPRPTVRASAVQAPARCRPATQWLADVKARDDRVARPTCASGSLAAEDESSRSTSTSTTP